MALNSIEDYLAFSETIRGFTYGVDSIELARCAYALPRDCVIVEVGAFFGRATVVLAGARKLRGDGLVHAIDAFDENVGDEYSIPYYREAVARSGITMLQYFLNTLRQADVSNWVKLHIGRAEDIGERWRRPVDMIYMTADQSIAGARLLWDLYVPHVRRGGTVVLDNATETDEPECADFDGHRLLAREMMCSSEFMNFRTPGTCAFAERV